MFSGIITHLGKIKQINIMPNHAREITIEVLAGDFNLYQGQSISCNGACMTVTRHQQNQFTIDASPESINLTTMQRWQGGDIINLESSLKIGDSLDGHFVTGHIDGITNINNITDLDNGNYVVEIAMPTAFKQNIARKGSITINGVSLTINSVDDDRGVFSLNIVPYTWQHTNFQYLQTTDFVNFEIDILSRYIERVVCLN